MALVRNHPNYPNFRMKIGVMPDFSGARWSYQEEPKGDIDGINCTFTLENEPVEKSESVYKDGMLMTRGLDYTMDYLNKKIIFTADDEKSGIRGQVPQPHSIIRVTYKYMDK